MQLEHLRVCCTVHVYHYLWVLHVRQDLFWVSRNVWRFDNCRGKAMGRRHVGCSLPIAFHESFATIVLRTHIPHFE